MSALLDSLSPSSTSTSRSADHSLFGPKTTLRKSALPPPPPNAADRDRQSLESLVDNLSKTWASSASTFASTRPTAPFALHCYTHKHNTHLTLSKPSGAVVISISCGNLGFRKAQRGSYEAAFQTSAWMMRTMQEREDVASKLEVVFRGFGEGRQAFLQALLGVEGRLIRGRIVKISDATKIKLGGVRSQNPRRL
ncbi:translational machinery component [Microthyrium microscopicum]|uniref:Translational machinery component n=1 Tax=Microthyrium microscopicum TaxID=703497 RepID=A0A6A6U6G5_9PEZI|nr:translational machinery component [Microthyrium microscopicum]